MDIDQKQQIRYDRQIRLWGDEGQQSIQQAQICIFGSSALASEILKSLVLAGIGSFHIIDDARINESDLGQNFFLDEKSFGKPRGECLVQLIMELNPSVHGQHSNFSFKEFSNHDLQMLLQFSLVIGTNMSTNEAIQLDRFLFENDIPFIYARVYGLLGYLRLSFREHVIWNHHNEENDPFDLRLDSPFPELLKMVQENDLNGMTYEQHKHTPYVILYFKALDIWKQRHNKQRNGNDNEEQMEEGAIDSNYPENTHKIRTEIFGILNEMRKPNDKGFIVDEENFDEAKTNLLKSIGRTKVSENVKRVLADPKAGPLLENNNLMNGMDQAKGNAVNNHFWILCSALRQFIAQNHHMPHSGQLPDMTSDSKRYTQLLGIYRKKSADDAAKLHELAEEIQKQRHSLLHTANAQKTRKSSSSFLPSNGSAHSETDESSNPEETDEDDLSRMSTSDVNEEQQPRISMSSECMEENGVDDHLGRSLFDPNYEEIIAATTANEPSAKGSGSGNSIDNQITFEQCQSFCKNASKMGIQYGASLSSEFGRNIQSILTRIDEPEFGGHSPPVVNPLTWYVLLRAVDRFQIENGQFPSEETDLHGLKRCLAELFAETKDPELIDAQEKLMPNELLNEVCRYGAAEPHVMAAILGGCVSQEAIKLCTHQYIPVDNSLIIDGHSQQSQAFRVNKQ